MKNFLVGRSIFNTEISRKISQICIFLATHRVGIQRLSLIAIVNPTRRKSKSGNKESEFTEKEKWTMGFYKK
jgi:hypothetical protein